MNYASETPLEAENDYPYETATRSCRYHGKGVKEAQLSGEGYAYVTPNNPGALSAAVSKQPVSVLLDAETSVF
jgi:hypothetical protein